MSLEDLSANRLGGEPVPADLAILFQHRERLLEASGFTLVTEAEAEPWNDRSHLTEAELADPSLQASLESVKHTNTLIAFVASHEDGEFLGYWRGPEGRAVADSPIVILDTEGQYCLLDGPGIAVALLDAWATDADEVQAFYDRIGLVLPPRVSPPDAGEPNDYSEAMVDRLLDGV